MHTGTAPISSRPGALCGAVQQTSEVWRAAAASARIAHVAGERCCGVYSS